MAGDAYDVAVLEGTAPRDYDSLCRQWAASEDEAEGWRELRGVLGGRRNGWWFLDPRQLPGFEGGPMWCFGPEREAKLCVSPDGAGFQIYDAERDEETMVEEVGQLIAWLDAHEPDDIDETLSPILREMMNRRGPLGPGR